MDELTQGLVVGRTADVRDWLADVSGASASILVVWMIQSTWSMAKRRQADQKTIPGASGMPKKP